MTAKVDIARRDGVLQLTMNNPAMRNAVVPEISRALIDALREAEQDASVGAAVLVGADGQFCSGGNVKAMFDNLAKPRAQQFERIGVLNELIRALRRFPKPVIAAVEGNAAGAGFSIALACDLIVAARDAKFSVAHVRIGLSPDGGPTLTLPRALPLQFASEILMQGSVVSAERLQQVGIVNRLSEPGAALGDANAWAAELAQGATGAIGRIKALLNRSFCPDLDTHLEAERPNFVDAMFGPEGREGITAFNEKRAARFSKE